MSNHTDQPSGLWQHCLQQASLSDVGLRRANNQDAKVVVIAGSEEIWRQRGHLFMVADGMGAHAAGELASKMAADTVALTYFKLPDLNAADALAVAVEEANRQIHERGEADPEFKGMGTTATALALLPEGAVVAHAGDSRAYRLRGDRYEQLTFDHSLVWEIRAARQFDGDDIPLHVPKNIITRSLGPNAQVQIDLEGPFPIVVGDTFLLCSDGLSGPVEDDEMGAILGSMPPDDAVRALVNLANLRGGPDNITVLVVRVTAPLEPGSNGSQTGGTARANGARAASVQPVQPWVSILLGVFALAALGAAAMHLWLVAAASVIGAVVAGVIALVQRYGSEPPTASLSRQPLGKGPYVASTCPPGSDFVDRVEQIVDELREAAEKGSWTVDWDRYRALVGGSTAAKQAGDFARAVRENFQAIDFLMTQLKAQRRPAGPHPSDSVLDR